MALIVAFGVAMAATWWLASGRSRLQIMDHPNERSLHEKPVPRSGGLAILAAMAVGWGMLVWSFSVSEAFLWSVAAALAVAAISLLDDLFELSAKIRMVVHVLAASSLLYGGLALPWGFVGGVVTLFAVVWMINLYNFMDGMDGFAGGMTLFGFLFLGGGGFLAGDVHFALLSWTVAAGAAGFLLFNFPPARIFMGDAGSATLGMLAAALSLWGVQAELFPFWFPVLLFSAFIVDATVTLLRRALRGEKVWQAHREHYYQRLVQAGWGHRKTVLLEYLLMLVSGVTGIGLLQAAPQIQWGGLAGWICIYFLLARYADQFCKRRLASAPGN